MKKEIWKPAPGFELTHIISNIGRMFKLAKGTCKNSQLRTDRKKIIPGKFLNQRIRAGYWSVNINRKDWVIHRIEAIAFVPNPYNLPEVNHKDGNKLNNDSGNFEWTTTQGNTIHAYDNGLAKSGERSVNSILKDDDVRYIRSVQGKISGAELARTFGVTKGAIYNIFNGSNWKRVE